jgi:hypothetical protein
VIVVGALAAADMGRLEHACAPALLQEPLPLEIDIRRVTRMDGTAAAVLDRLARRGARILKGADPPPSADPRSSL